MIGISKLHSSVGGFEHLSGGVMENIVTCLLPTHFPPCSLSTFWENPHESIEKGALSSDRLSEPNNTVRFSPSQYDTTLLCSVLICSDLVVNVFPIFRMNIAAFALL